MSGARRAALAVGVVVPVFQIGLVHVLMGVFGSVVVGVGVFMRQMVVLVRGVRVRVSHVGMVVFVRMWPVVGVLFGHGFPFRREILCVTSLFGRHPTSPR
ncbi:hypothetical protein MHEI_26560 [Mycobacterium heidelbergense]|nr:hypothetical protein MHEI_26560 [Mycobacterium heidelbergense]